MNVIFWHICGLTNYKKIVTSQFNTIKKTGLLDKVDKIYVTYLGENKTDINFLLRKSNKIVLDKYDPFIFHYERLCLHSMHDFSQQNNANILYIHAKGVSTRFDGDSKLQDNIKQWRKMMENFLIYHHEECIKLLEQNDALGCCLVNCRSNDLVIDKEDHAYHFSGNFWWSKTDYIKTLPRIREDIVGNLAGNCAFHLCERWVLQKWPNIKLVEVYKDPHSCHFYSNPPSIDYLKADLNKVTS